MNRAAAASRGVALLVPILIVLVILAASVYTVDEAEQAIIIQFGAPVGDPITQSGLHFKKPFIQEVRRFDKRLLAWDGDPNQIPTLGREFISVDTIARWRIADPLLFLKSVRDEMTAQSRLDDIIDSAVRDVLSSAELVEIVCSKGGPISAGAPEQIDGVQVSTHAVPAPVRTGREELAGKILEEAQKRMPQYGIELRDVRIKRLNYIPSVQQQVFNRMISERQRIAARFRAEGQGQSAEIIGDMSRQLAETLSGGRRDAEFTRGGADAEAARIYNEAYGADPEFYAFYRSLESYAQSIGPGATIFLSSDSDYFRYLRESKPPAP